MIQSVLKSMKIIELLGSNPAREFSVSEISSALNLDKGTCTNIIKTLASGGFAQQDGPRKGYKLGYEMYKLTTGSVDNDELTKIAREDIDQLGLRFNETAMLSVIRNDKRISLYSTEPDRNLVVRTSSDKSVYAANTGRVILANYTPAHQEKFIIRMGLPSGTEWPEVSDSSNPSGTLQNALMQIKRDGYAIQIDANGIIGFAAPLFKKGHVTGSIGMYLPVGRMESKEEMLEAVIATAERICRKIDSYKF